ncbi:MAG: AMP-binding protein, partial [Nocardia sp.]|nr:AMP-binding protein [Nocardia sp.]
VPVRALFETATVAGLAVWADRQAGTGGLQALTAGPRPEWIPLSLAQQRMWFLNRMDTDSAVENIPAVVRLSGLLDRQALHIAVADVLARHESLRTRYPEHDGVPYQEIVPTSQLIPDLTPIEISESELLERVSEVLLGGFDVSAAPPFRVRLFEVTPTEHVLVVVVHHISGDGWSMGPLTRDVMTAYAARVEGGEPMWAPLPVQYADFSLWQRRVLGSEDDPESLISQQISFWEKTLGGVPEQLDLPADRPRPEVRTGRGAVHDFQIDAALRSRLAELARSSGTTMFMVMHAALTVLLSRLSGEGDITVGTPVAGRGERAVDDLVGMFVNTLVLRTQVDVGARFTDLLGAVRAGDLAAFGHADVPFERLVEVLNPPRSQARHPLFQVALTMQNIGGTAFELAGLTASGVEIPVETAKFDLQLTVNEIADGGMAMSWNYTTDLFDPETVSAFADRLVRILDAVAADPAAVVGDIDLLDEQERLDVSDRWALAAADATTGPFADHTATLADLFERAAATHPHRTAVKYLDQELTYAELDERAEKLARRLNAIGAGPETLVAVVLPRSTELVVALMAVIKSGAGYVPIDPTYPADRIAYVLGDSAPAAAIVAPDSEIELPAGLPSMLVEADGDAPTADRPVPLTAANIAYVIYTSGSTGRPKGVAVQHANVVRL